MRRTLSLHMLLAASLASLALSSPRHIEIRKPREIPNIKLAKEDLRQRTRYLQRQARKHNRRPK